MVHAVVRDGRRGVGRSQDKVQLVLFPEVKPLALIHFTLSNQLPVLVGRLGVPVAQQAGPQRILSDIAHPQIVEVFDGTGQVKVEAHLGGAAVVPFAGTHERGGSLDAIGIQQLGGQLETLVR